MKAKFLYIILIVTKFILVYFLFSYFLNFALNTCISCRVQQTIEIGDFFHYFIYFAFAYSVIGFYLDWKTAKVIGKRFNKLLIVLSVGDVILIPLFLIAMLHYYRVKGRDQIIDRELYNLYFLGLAMIGKHIIILGAREFLGRKKTEQPSTEA